MEQWLDHSDLFEKIQELIELGLHDDAKSMLDRYAHAFNDEWEFHFLYSRLYAEQNRPAEAITCLLTALTLDPDNVDCLLGLFYAHTMQNQIQKAGCYLQQAEKLDPENELVVSALIWYYSEINDLSAAIEHFERIRDKGPSHPETFRNAGIAYDRTGFYDNAAICYLTALEMHPQYDEVRELLSDLYIANGKTELAVSLYEQALAGSPKNIRYLSRLVFCLSQNAQPQKALAIAEDTIRKYPNSPIGYVDLAYACLNSDDLDRALTSVGKALDIAPLDAESFRVQAIILSEKGDNEAAEKAFESALSLDSDNIETLRDVYHHYWQTGNFKKMEEFAFKAIAKEDPSRVEDFWFLADYYRKKKKYLKAFSFLHKAFVFRPGEHDLIPMMVDILIAKKHVRLSLKFLKQYIDLAGWNEAMEQISSYPEFRKKNLREGLDFLHYSGENAIDFHRSLFSRYINKSLTFSLVVLIPFIAVPVYLLLGNEGLIGLTAFTLVFAGFALLVYWFRKKNRFAGSYQ
ncbi:MAG: tetratricopeptide repeat protein [Chitinispirillaceae bacterium]|nr:tetratricopeptide repeat protein [Chitinispirillaceae bacterium]